MPISKCKECGTEFRWNPSQKAGNYCSMKCRTTHVLNEAIQSGSYTKGQAYKYFKEHTEYKCSCCGIADWNDSPITLQIDHIDGINTNNVIENYRYLCPNCHTQTDTWGVKNASAEGKLRMIIGGKKAHLAVARKTAP
jgi:Zn finger protein HypA/HybF involved in hydrogenase expression